MLAGTALGSKEFAAALIEADERLDQVPMTALEKIELMDPIIPTNDKSNLQVPGLLHAEAVIDDEQESAILKQIEDDNVEWDVSTRRKLKHFGFSFDAKGNHVALTTPIPDYLTEAHHIAADILLKNGLNHQLNQCTVAVYEPGVGVGDHKENPELGESVATRKSSLIS